MAQHQMRVGHCRLLAAGAVAGWTRHRSGARRPDRQRAIRQPRDRATAGTDRHHVNHRQRQRPFTDAATLRQRDLPAAQQADIGAGAADIDRDDVANAGRRRDIARADHPRGRAGQHGERRRAADRRGTGDTAIRLHQQQRCSDVGIRQAALQPLHIGGDRRHHTGIHDRRQAALVLAHHRQHIDRRRHRHVRQCGAQHLGDAAFMRGIGERVQQADRDRLHIQPAQLRGGLVHARFVERCQHDTARPDAFTHLEHARRRHRALRLHPGEQVRLARNVLPPDLQHVPKSRGGHQRGARGLALQDQIGGDRRAMQHARDILRASGGLRQSEHDAGQECFGRIRRRARRLGAPLSSARAVRQRDIGERAADIDSDREISWRHRRVPMISHATRARCHRIHGVAGDHHAVVPPARRQEKRNHRARPAAPVLPDDRTDRRAHRHRRSPAAEYRRAAARCHPTAAPTPARAACRD